MTPPAPEGRLAENVFHFVRALRRAGLSLGPAHALKATEAVAAIDLSSREEFYWALSAALISRPEDRQIFDQAFHVFWKNPDYLERMMGMMLPSLSLDLPEEDRKPPPPQRLADAFAPDAPPPAPPPAPPKVDVDMRLVWSDTEALKTVDFETMSAEEAEAAKRAIRKLVLPMKDLPTRRFRTDPRGARADMRATLRAQLRSGGAIPLARKAPRQRPPPLVALCDVSGSMARYSRMLLHFLHALSTARTRMHSFVFGTRLTNITRQLAGRDVDIALDKVSHAVTDWEGGTRIGECLHRFNVDWSRRVLGQGAVVLLITDGLDRQDDDMLAHEAERLGKSCRRLIWLNPLLRYDGFEPKARGVRAILPHVDEFRATHNLASLEDLAAALSAPAGRVDPRRREGMERWLKRM